jgi:chromosome segregation ATPase
VENGINLMRTNANVYLLDEWDANLDRNNRAQAKALIGELAIPARLIEISYRDA